MNILIVAEGRFPDFMGGAELVIHHLGKHLADRGHIVHTLTRRAKETDKSDELIDNIYVHRYFAPVIGSCFYKLYPFFSFWGARQRFIKLNKVVSFDVIIFNQPFPALGILSSSISKSIKKIYIFHSSTKCEYLAAKNQIESNINLFDKLIIRVVNQMERYALKKSQKIVTLSKYMREKIVNIHDIKAEKIEVIPGGVDTNTFLPPGNVEEIIRLRERFKIPDHSFVIFVAKRLYGGMGLENIIDAVELLVKNGEENVIFLIAGAGPIKKDLENRIVEKNLKKSVWLLGEVSHDIIKHYYQLADLFISTREEPFGLVTLEALACGLPVLSVPTGGTVEILEGLSKNLLFEDTTSVVMANSILKYLNSPEELLALKSECRRYVENNYTWSIAGERMEQLLALREVTG